MRSPKTKLGMAMGLGLLATPALAHEGHHETMTLAQQVQHLVSQPDHLLAAVGLVALAFAGTWTWRRAKARR